MKTKILLFIPIMLLFGIMGCTRTEQPKTEENTKKTLIKVTDPVCKMEIDMEKAMKVEYEENEFYFCSEECKEQFEKEPEKFIEKEMVTDPVCGMSISKSGEITHMHEGEKYHFCSPGCKEKFEKEPEKYMGKD